MKFEAYLLTESRLKTINTTEFTKYVDTQYSDAYEKWFENDYNYIWRGMTHKTTAAIGDGKAATKRKSAWTSNHSTLFLDNDPSWSKFPKRSESFICSTAKGKAADYGSLYSVLPKNGANIGVCPEDDIWNSFSRTMNSGTIYEFNRMLLDLFYKLEKEGHKIPLQDDDYGKMVKSFKEVKKLVDSEHPLWFKELLADDGFYYNYGNIFRNNSFDGDILDLMKQVYDPKKNGFKIVKSGADIALNREVWMSGTCLFVNRDMSA